MSEQSLAEMKTAFFSPSQEPAVEAPVEEASESAPEKGEADGNVVEVETNAELESYKKRFQDTQKAFHNAYSKVNAFTKRAVENGWMTEEEAKQELDSAKSNDFSVEDNPLDEISKKFDSEVGLVGGVLGYSDEELQKYTEGFKQMFSLDPTIQEKLVNVPANQVTKWILDEGKNFLDVSPVIQEHGSALSAIRALNKPFDMDALREELKAELLEEMRQPVTNKPNLSRTGTSRTETAPARPAKSLSALKKAHFKTK